MADYYDSIDLLWTDDGDYAVGRDGDIADTSFDPLLAIAQDVYDRVKSDLGDYSENQKIGASLADFTGETNTRERGKQIEKRVFNSMRPGGDINLGDISVTAFPISKHSISVRFRLSVQPTAWNRGSRLLDRVFIYSFVENNVFPANTKTGD